MNERQEPSVLINDCFRKIRSQHAKIQRLRKALETIVEEIDTNEECSSTVELREIARTVLELDYDEESKG